MTTNIFYKKTFAHQAASKHTTKALIIADSVTTGDRDVNYKPLYYFLFNGITDVLGRATNPETIAALKQLQCDSENLFIEQTEEKGNITPLTKNRP
ncbi:MAG: hypothetical protein FWC60_07720 [Firmicutes bacterium]|nr:hypothetical protein [Bacillota bacterium]